MWIKWIKLWEREYFREKSQQNLERINWKYVDNKNKESTSQMRFIHNCNVDKVDNLFL